MAYESPYGPLTFLASTGLKQYTFVALSTAVQLIKPTTSGKILGVLTSSGTTNSTVERVQTVQVIGVAKVLNGGTTSIAAGDSLTASTDGTAVAGTTNFQVAIALANAVSTSTSAEVLPILLLQHAKE